MSRKRKHHKNSEKSFEELERETLGCYPWYNNPDWKSEDEQEEEVERKNIFIEKVDGNFEDAYNNIGRALLFPCALNNVFLIIVYLLLGGTLWLKFHEWCLGESFCGNPSINYVILGILIFFDISVIMAIFKTIGARAWFVIGIPLWILGFIFKIPFAGITGIIMTTIGGFCYKTKK